MARYFSAPTSLQKMQITPRADRDDWWEPGLCPDLWVPDHRPVDTGLVDIRGDAIMRAPYPIGFGRDGEW